MDPLLPLDIFRHIAGCTRDYVLIETLSCTCANLRHLAQNARAEFSTIYAGKAAGKYHGIVSTGNTTHTLYKYGDVLGLYSEKTTARTAYVEIDVREDADADYIVIIYNQYEPNCDEYILMVSKPKSNLYRVIMDAEFTSSGSLFRCIIPEYADIFHAMFTAATDVKLDGNLENWPDVIKKVWRIFNRPTLG